MCIVIIDIPAECALFASVYILAAFGTSIEYRIIVEPKVEAKTLTCGPPPEVKSQRSKVKN